MDPVVLVLTRDENVGDKIEFSIKKDIPIRFVKKLLEAKLPYHPDVQTIEIFFDQQLQSDDVMVYSLKEESRNIVNLSFHDNKPYKEWMSTPGSTNTIPQELTEEIIRDLAANPPQRRRFRLIVDRGDGEAERQIRQNGRVPFVIRLSLDNIIHSGIVFYVVYYTELLKKASKWIGFSISPFFTWFLFTILDIMIPSCYEFIKEKYKEKKPKDMVDFTPNGFLGDLWLCIYYFFATLLPFNWGPRVFRD